VVGGEYHDFDFVRRELLGLIGEDDRLRTTCNADFRETDALAAADLLISYTGNVFPDEPQLRALRAFLEEGGRWLAIHGAAAFTCFRPPEIDIGGIKLPGLTDTPDRQPAYMDTLGLRFISHLAQQPFTIRRSSSHPLVAGLEPFEVVDEPYILELRAGWDVLLDAQYTGEAPGYVAGPWLEDVPRPQALLRRQGKGEILYVAPGHACGRFDLRPFIAEMPVQRGPWTSDSYRELLRRAIRWGTGQPIEPTTAPPRNHGNEAIVARSARR
jgi:type 1 glutamine amidotransferase